MNYHQRSVYLEERYKALKGKVQTAYKRLRRQGYVCRSTFMCCSGCACYELGAKYGDDHPYVFFHKQDAERASKGGPLYLAWGGNGDEIADTLREEGLEVEWDGSDLTRILVRLPDEIPLSELHAA